MTEENREILDLLNGDQAWDAARRQVEETFVLIPKAPEHLFDDPIANLQQIEEAIVGYESDHPKGRQEKMLGLQAVATMIACIQEVREMMAA